jgi:hypothetical protein
MISAVKILEMVNYGIEVKLPDGSIISRDRSFHKYVLNTNDEIRNIDENSLKEYLSKFNYWKAQDGELYELNQMSTSHLENAIKHVDTLLKRVKKINGESVTDFYKGKMKSILRDRYITSLEIDDKDIGIDL